jgi:hypothetical protein
MVCRVEHNNETKGRKAGRRPQWEHVLADRFGGTCTLHMVLPYTGWHDPPIADLRGGCGVRGV